MKLLCFFSEQFADAAVRDIFVVGYSSFFLEIERAILKHALSVSKNNRTHAAALLGMKRTTFVHKCIRTGLIKGKWHQIDKSDRRACQRV
jgi:DNA-binding protein Fis